MLIIAVKQLLTKICIAFLEIFLSSKSGGRPVDSALMLAGRFVRTMGVYKGEARSLVLGRREKFEISVLRKIESW